MFCLKCGNEIPDASEFCFKCGVNLRESLGDHLDSAATLTNNNRTLSGTATISGENRLRVIAGRYEILSTIGKGGMGVVYKARDTKLGRVVAIKTVLPAIRQNKKALDRFMTEAKSLATLNHPNIVQVYDAGEDDSETYIAMEYVDGEALSDYVKREGKLPEARSVEIFGQICQGVLQAHKKNIVHRDIKPANILLADDGISKLVDFGIAQVLDDSDITKTGVAMGTPLYMAPEQQKDAKHIDSLADIYSLGLVFYELLTGESPRVIHMERLPMKYRGLIAKTLRQVPQQRHQTVEQLLSDLQTRGKQGAPDEKKAAVQEMPEKAASNKKFLIAAAAGIVLIILSYFIFSGDSSSSSSATGSSMPKFMMSEKAKINELLRMASIVEIDLTSNLNSFLMQEAILTRNSAGNAICIEPAPSDTGRVRMTCKNAARMEASGTYTDLDSIITYFIDSRSEKSPFDKAKPLFVKTPGIPGTITVQQNGNFIRVQAYASDTQTPVFNKDIMAE